MFTIMSVKVVYVLTITYMEFLVQIELQLKSYTSSLVLRALVFNKKTNNSVYIITFHFEAQYLYFIRDI